MLELKLTTCLIGIQSEIYWYVNYYKAIKRSYQKAATFSLASCLPTLFTPFAIPQCNCPHYCRNLLGVTVCANNSIFGEHTFVRLGSQVLFGVEKFIYRLLGLMHRAGSQSLCILLNSSSFDLLIMYVFLNCAYCK